MESVNSQPHANFLCSYVTSVTGESKLPSLHVGDKGMLNVKTALKQMIVRDHVMKCEGFFFKRGYTSMCTGSSLDSRVGLLISDELILL